MSAYVPNGRQCFQPTAFKTLVGNVPAHCVVTRFWFFLHSHPQLLSKSLNSYELQLIAASLTTIDSEEQMRRLKPKAKGNAKLTGKGEVKSSSKKASFKQTPKGKKTKTHPAYRSDNLFNDLLTRQGFAELAATT